MRNTVRLERMRAAAAANKTREIKPFDQKWDVADSDIPEQCFTRALLFPEPKPKAAATPPPPYAATGTQDSTPDKEVSKPPTEQHPTTTESSNVGG